MQEEVFFLNINVAYFPPNPNVAPHGLFSHCGGFFSCIVTVGVALTTGIAAMPGKESAMELVGWACKK